MLDAWPHLEPLRNQLMPKGACEVGILIGYDCSKALAPCDVISPPGDTEGPFGQKTVLGWGIVGVISQPSESKTDLIGHSHRIAAKQVTESESVLQRRTMKDPLQDHCTPRPSKKKRLDNRTSDGNRVLKRKLTRNFDYKSSILQQNRVDIDTEKFRLPYTTSILRFIIFIAFAALSLSQFNVVRQDILLALSGTLCVGIPVLATRLVSHGLAGALRHLNSKRTKVTGPQIVLLRRNRRRSLKRSKENPTRHYGQ